MAGAMVPVAADLAYQTGSDYASSGKEGTVGGSARKVLTRPETVTSMMGRQGLGESAEILRNAQGGEKPGFWDVAKAAATDAGNIISRASPIGAIQNRLSSAAQQFASDFVEGPPKPVGPDMNERTRSPASLRAPPPRAARTSTAPAATAPREPYQRTVTPVESGARERMTYTAPEGEATGVRRQLTPQETEANAARWLAQGTMPTTLNARSWDAANARSGATPTAGAGGGTPSAPRGAGGGLSVVSGRSAEMQEATDRNVADLDRQTLALRQLREARNPGVTTGGTGGGEIRGVKDDFWARPGDSFGDSARRENRYNSLLDTATSRDATRSQRRAAVEAAEQMRAPFETATAARQAQRGLDAQTAAAQTTAQATAAARQAQEQGLDRRAQLTADTQLAAAQIAQRGQNARTGATLDAKQAAQDTKQRTEAWTGLGKQFVDMGYEDTPAFFSWLQTNAAKVQKEMGYDQNTMTNFLSAPTAQELLKWYPLYQRDMAQRESWWPGDTLSQSAAKLYGR